VYKMMHNKSGRNNTGDDNGLMQWAATADYVMEKTGEPPIEVDSYWDGLFNGDDGETVWWGGLNALEWKVHLASMNIRVELENEEPRYTRELTFLSHHLRERNVPGLGDIIVAAGNRDKLNSSIQWLRRNADYTMEENALAHLLGLRIMLWPWRADFLEVEELIDQYVDTIESTPSIRNILKARIPEQQIIELHTRYEDGLAFLPESGTDECRVRDLIISAILFDVDDMSTVNAKEMARRKAQSRKDKAASKKQARPKAVKTADDHSRKTTAPAAVGYEKSSGFKEQQGKRFKNSIVVEGSDHLEYVAIPATEGPGVVLNEVYVSPSEFGGTRLEKYAALYEKYLFEELRFEYVPSIGSGTAGSIVLAYDKDINDPTPPPNEQGVRQFTSFEGSVDGNVWTRHVCKAKLTQPDSGYYTNPIGEDRLSYQGQFYIAQTVATGLTAATTIGRLYIHYKCHFFTPQLEGSQNIVQIVGSKTGVEPATPVGTFGDFLKKVNDLQYLVKGVQQWKPVVDSLGKYFVDLPQGVYNVKGTFEANTPNTQQYSANGSTNVYGPSLEPKEPMPATAPQPWITTQPQTIQTFGLAGDIFSGAGADYLVGVPRGGAKMYMDWETGGITDVSGQGQDISLTIQRLSNYIPQYYGTYLAMWRGVEECSQPRKFETVAKGRSNIKRVIKTLGGEKKAAADFEDRDSKLKEQRELREPESEEFKTYVAVRNMALERGLTLKEIASLLRETRPESSNNTPVLKRKQQELCSVCDRPFVGECAYCRK
jgi:hypothetical protein